MRVLVLGHPRSGTGYTAHCFRQSGWDVGHEVCGRDGIASWMWAVKDEWGVPWGEARGDKPVPATVLHILRDPAACVSSVAYTERTSEQWRAKFISIPAEFGDIERAVWSVYGWSRLIERNHPTHTTQLGNVESAVEEITGRAPEAPSVLWRNERLHASLKADEIKAMRWVHPKTAQMWDRITADYADQAFSNQV